MGIYKTKLFNRWASDEGLDDVSLLVAVKEMKAGLYDADLGGGLFKKRIARKGKGKSSGFRTLIATNKENKWFFVFGFPKNKRSNIDQQEQAALKKLATVVLSYTEDEIKKAKLANELMEVICDAEKEISNSGSSS